MGRDAQAQAGLEESRSIARDIGDHKAIAATLQPLSFAFLGQGNAVSAQRHSEEAIERERDSGDKRHLAAALTSLAQLNRAAGRLDDAAPAYETVLALGRELADPGVVVTTQLKLAMVRIERRLPARVPGMQLEVATFVEQTRWTLMGQDLLWVCAGHAESCREVTCAARFFGAAESQAAQ